MTPPKPLFCLVRPGLERFTTAGELIVEPGTMVPLIPMDMLPEWLEVVGVPRQLTAEQASRMMNVGAFHPDTDTYRLKFHVSSSQYTDNRAEASGSTTDESIGGTGEASQRVAPSSSSSSSSSTSRKSAPKPSRKTAQGLSTSRHKPPNNSGNNSKSLQRSASLCQQTSVGAPDTAPKSPFCRHWCHQGTCKWGLSCRDEHSMPTTTDGLHDVGLDDYPQWWLASIGVVPMPAGVWDVTADTTAAKKSPLPLPSSGKRRPKKRERPQRSRKDKSVHGRKAVASRAGKDGDECDLMADSEEEKRAPEAEDFLIEI